MKTAQTSKDLVLAYLQDIGRVPLLTPEQEILYGRQVKQARMLSEIREILAAHLNRPPNLEEWVQQARLSLEDFCPKDVIELQNIIAQGEIAKRKMIEANLRFVVSIAKRYAKCKIDLLDLIQEGNIGLQRGVEKFDPAMGWRFSTYAYWWIRKSITQAIAKQGRIICLPVQVGEKLSKIKKTYHQLSESLGRAATVTELAQALNLNPQTLRNYLGWASHPLSLDVGLGNAQEIELGAILEDPSASPEKFVMESSFATDFEELLADLTPQQREVLTLRFGLADGQALSRKQAGHRLNLNQQQVRKLEKLALKKLRDRRVEAEELLHEMCS
jgi:RNA polymerase nonessential primary-like sigma factor